MCRTVLVVLLLAFFCGGCRPVGVSDVAGKYARKSGALEDKIELYANGTFRQTVSSTNGVEWIKTGEWILTNQVIQMDVSYSTFDLERKAATIPPAEVSMQTLWIERGRLVKSESEPKWFRVTE